MSAEKTEPLESFLQAQASERDLLTPEDMSQKTARFENWLNGVFLPAVGLNLLLIGGLWLRDSEPALGVVVTPLYPLLGAIALGLLARARNLYNARLWQFVGAACASLFWGALMLPLPVVSSAFALGAVGLFLAITLRHPHRRRCPWIFIIYLPFIVWSMLPALAAERLVLESLSLGAMLAVFQKCRMKSATLLTLVVLIGVAWKETQEGGLGTAPMIALILAGLIFAVLHEVRMPKEEQSAFRQFVGQGIIVALMLCLVIATGLLKGQARWVTWAWAGGTILYQGLFCLKEKFTVPTRVSWISWATCVAVWALDEAVGWGTMSVLTLGIAALTQIVARRLERPFLSDTALLQGLIIAGLTLDLNHRESGDLTVLSVAMLTFWFLTLSSQRIVPGQELPLWKGFLAEKQVHVVQQYGLVAARPFLKFGFVSIVVSWGSFVLLWLRYLKGDMIAPGFRYLVYTFAHLFGASVAASQVPPILGSVLGTPGPLNWPDHFVAALVWIAWGTVLFGSGTKRSFMFARLVGIVLIILPIILFRNEADFNHWLMIVTGLALSMVGWLIKQRFDLSDSPGASAPGAAPRPQE